jgi:hypothetical protein
VKALLSLAALLSLCAAMVVPAAAAAGPYMYCGAMTTYEPPTATQNGRIVIGSRTHVIVAGATFGSGVSPTGGNRCIGGTVDASGRFTSITSAHPYGAVGPANVVTYMICGTVADYRPPTASAPGLLVFHVDGRETIVPQGTTLALAPGANPGNRCFTGGLNAAGDAIVIAAAAAAATDATASAATLPSSSAADATLPVVLVIAAAVLALATVLLRGRRRA